MTKKLRGTKSPITMRRALLTAVVVLLFTAVLIAPAAADVPTTSWVDNVDTSWYYDKPDASEYIITTPAQLAGLSKLTYSEDIKFDDVTIHLGNDIDLSGHLWTPIYGGHFVNSVLDGHDNTISNMVITDDSPRTNAFGFFQQLNGGNTVKNLIFNNAHVVGSTEIVGILAGYGNDNNILTVENVTIQNSYVRGTEKVGGFIGMAMGEDKGIETKFKNCHIRNTEIVANYNKAGFVGLMFHTIIIEDCSSNVMFHTLSEIDLLEFYESDRKLVECLKPTEHSASKVGHDGDPVIGTYAHYVEPYSNDLHCAVQSDFYVKRINREGCKIAESETKLFSINYNAAASIGNVKYFHLKDAMNAALDSDETVKLELCCDMPQDIVIPDGKVLTIDLNGHELTGENDKVDIIDSTKTYTVTWYDEDLTTVLYTDENVIHGTMPSYKGKELSTVVTEEFTYTFAGWDPVEVKATEHTRYNATYSKAKTTYTITWNVEGASATQQFDYGVLPMFSGDVPTKPSDDTYDYIFKGWDKPLTEVKGAVTYTAQFAPIDKNAAEGTLQPVIQSQAKTAGGITTITADIGTPITLTAADTAEISDVNGEVTITVKFNSAVGTAGDTPQTISGTVTSIGAEYIDAKLGTTDTNVGEVRHQVTLTFLNDKLTTTLPNVDAAVHSGVVTKVKDQQPKLQPVAMITVDGTHINPLLAENGVSVTFIVSKTWAEANNGKLWGFHLKGDTLTPMKIETLTPFGTDYCNITIIGNGFSTYGLATGELKQDDTNTGGSSTPQGSSVWLTESQTPTEQPTETPTDTVPTDIPTTQPTPTETETPGFGVLAVLAGLGAVAVLRRK